MKLSLASGISFAFSAAVSIAQGVDFDAIASTPLAVKSGKNELTRKYFESKILPESYQVHLNEGRHKYNLFPDYSFRTVHVNNPYLGRPGGYVACYSKIEDSSFYKVPHTDMYMHGLIRAPGVYDVDIFRPFAEDMDDISAFESHSSALCRQLIDSCVNGECWAGGKTGRFVGIRTSLLVSDQASSSTSEK